MSTPNDVVDPVAVPETLLDGFTTNLFVQARCDESAQVCGLIAQTGAGVVYTMGHQQRPLHWAAGPVNQTRRAAGAVNILVDRNLYSGKHRKPGSEPPNHDWISFQRHSLELPWALTDSGFCNTLADVKTTLDATAGLQDRVVVMLALPTVLLSADAPALVDLINNQSHPVAIALQDEADPFDLDGVAAGLIHILASSARPVLLLRCDTSALGAIAYGAAVGAVGTHSALRHIYPTTDKPGGGPEQLSFVIPSLLGYFLDTRFRQAYDLDPTQTVWTCSCRYCRPVGDLTWIAEAGDQSAQFDAAYLHSVTALAALGTQLMGLSDKSGPQQAWLQMCTTAQVNHDLISNPSGSPWKPKKALAQWWSAGTRSPQLAD